jgi:hypothetical protein
MGVLAVLGVVRTGTVLVALSPRSRPAPARDPSSSRRTSSGKIEAEAIHEFR